MLISGIITEGIHGLLIWLSVQLFKIAAFVFEIFIILSTGELITQDSYELVIQNFYILLGIIMLFVVAFTLLKGMVNADDSTKGATTIKKMIINLITSAIIMAVLPAIFAFMYDFQESFIVRQNTIGKFFGYGTVGDTSDSPIEQKNLNLVESASYKLVNGVFTAFFNITTGTCAKTEKTYSGSLEECQKAEESNDGWWFWESDSISVSYKTQDGYTKRIQLTNLHEAINFVDEYGDFSVYTAFAENVDEGSMDFSFLLSLVAGGFLIYIAVSYCFDMALRLVKLVFYQLIAPIPIFFRVIPEGKMNGMFDKWMKITITCYLEVFIRIFIFYFCVFLCTKMMEAPFLTEDVYKYGFMTGFLTKAFVLMGIITFMKQAPKLFSEVTGIDTGNMSLGIKDKLAAGGAFTAGAILGGAGTGFGRNLVNAAGNIKNNWKGATGGQRAKLLAKGLGSTIAGTTSGAFHSGRNSLNAKSFADMKSSVIKGGGAVDKNRITRADKNKRYQATGNNWFTKSAIGGRVMDTLQGAGDYFSGGADKYSGIIKTADEMTGAYDKMEAQAKKIMEKFYNDADIVARPKSAKDFKGNNDSELFSLYQKYGNDASLSLIQSDLKKMESIDPASLVSIDNYKDAKGKVDMAAYNAALEVARIDHSKRVANTRELLTQLEKKSTEYIIQEAIVHGNEGKDWTSTIKQSDLMGVLSAAKEFESTFKANGNSVTDPISGKTYDKGINLSANDVQATMDSIQKAYKNVGNKAKQESADMRRKAEQRKSE